MARWNNLPGALIAALVSGGAFALYGHPWFGLLYGSIFLIVWAFDTWFKHEASLTPCAECGRKPNDIVPETRVITHPLRPLIFHVITTDPSHYGPPCGTCGKPTPKKPEKGGRNAS